MYIKSYNLNYNQNDLILPTSISKMKVRELELELDIKYFNLNYNQNDLIWPTF